MKICPKKMVVFHKIFDERPGNVRKIKKRKSVSSSFDGLFIVNQTFFWPGLSADLWPFAHIMHISKKGALKHYSC